MIRTADRDYAALHRRVLHIWNYDETLSENQIASRLHVSGSFVNDTIDAAIAAGTTKRVRTLETFKDARVLHKKIRQYRQAARSA